MLGAQGPLSSLATARPSTQKDGWTRLVATSHQGIARDGHIPTGNHEIIRTDGAMPITGSYMVQAHHMAELDLMVETCPRQCLHHRSAMT